MRDGRFALIVASSQYSDPTLTHLQAPAHDAASLAAVLGAEAIGGFQVETLDDQPARTVMQEIETFFDGRGREDLVLLYFSGHGILDEGARLYFATTDTRVDRPRSTAVPAAFVNDVMGECRSRRQVLVLDCCNSGSFARGIKAGGRIGTAERFEGRGRVVITASDALQYAFEGGKIEGESTASVFTHILVDGLKTGDADLNRDGYVSLDELYEYVYGPDPDRTHEGGGERRAGGRCRAAELPGCHTGGKAGYDPSSLARSQTPSHALGRRGDRRSGCDRRGGSLPADEG
jgi:Caspase domain